MISPATILAPCSAVDAAALRDAFFVRLPSETTRETIRPSRPLGADLGVVVIRLHPPSLGVTRAWTRWWP